MNRSRLVAAVAFAALLSLVGIVSIGSSPGNTSAQDASMQGHPLVGLWLVDNDPESDTDVPENVSFSSDGTIVDVNGAEVTLGVWEATGPSTANAMFSQYFADDEDNYDGGYTVRVMVEVSADGTSFTGQYTVELLNPDGTTSGQAGPATVNATKVVVEAPGTPVMTQDELFGSFEDEAEATPES